MTDTKKKASDVYWFAIMAGGVDSMPVIVRERTQKELKKSLSKYSDCELVSVMKGKEFQFKVQKQFEFSTTEQIYYDRKEDEVPNRSLTGHPAVDQLQAAMGNA